MMAGSALKSAQSPLEGCSDGPLRSHRPKSDRCIFGSIGTVQVRAHLNLLSLMPAITISDITACAASCPPISSWKRGRKSSIASGSIHHTFPETIHLGDGIDRQGGRDV